MLSSKSQALICLATLVIAAPVLTAGQNSAPAAKPLAFEVVSIRPSPPAASFGFQRTPDGFRATGVTLGNVILLAHLPISLWSTNRIQNAPAWVSHDRYDINAKVAPQDLDAWTHQGFAEPVVLHAMLLSMLEDRCHLQLHTIPAEIPGFALAVSRRSPSLHPSTPGETMPEGMKLSDGGVARGERLEDGTTTWHFHDAPIASLTNFMSMQAHTRILDQTGLPGRYDFALAMAPDGIRIDHGEIKDPANVWDLRALGLRTLSTKVPTITLVIDHIDPPSEN
jgi:uncharacterized protein (TIGR03435 family)